MSFGIFSYHLVFFSLVCVFRDVVAIIPLVLPLCINSKSESLHEWCIERKHLASGEENNPPKNGKILIEFVKIFECAHLLFQLLCGCWLFFSPDLFFSFVCLRFLALRLCLLQLQYCWFVSFVWCAHIRWAQVDNWIEYIQSSHSFRNVFCYLMCSHV